MKATSVAMAVAQFIMRSPNRQQLLSPLQRAQSRKVIRRVKRDRKAAAYRAKTSSIGARS